MTREELNVSHDVLVLRSGDVNVTRDPVSLTRADPNLKRDDLKLKHESLLDTITLSAILPIETIPHTSRCM